MWLTVKVVGDDCGLAHSHQGLLSLNRSKASLPGILSDCLMLK